MLREQPVIALLIDVGNSRVRVAGWRKSDGVMGSAAGDRRHFPQEVAPLVPIGSWSTTRIFDDGGKTFRSDLKRHLERGKKIPVILCSVVPSVTEMFKELSPEVVVVDHTCELPFEMALEEPAQVGADRLCNMAAAAQANLASAIVVDAGTATTVDVLKDGVFVGGLIAPGMAVAAASLSQATAKLPAIPFAEGELAAGPSTTVAMARGAFHAGLGGIETLIRGMEEQFGMLPVVVTGGLGHFLDNSTRHHDPDWTFRGAAYLAQIT